MTNSERIRAMTDAELAKELALIAGWDRKEYNKCKRCPGVEAFMLQWLATCADESEGLNHEKITRIEEYMPHTVAEVMCWKCGKRWIAVFPSETLLKHLECSSCGCAGYAFMTGQDIEQGSD